LGDPNAAAFYQRQEFARAHAVATAAARRAQQDAARKSVPLSQVAAQFENEEDGAALAAASFAVIGGCGLVTGPKDRKWPPDPDKHEQQSAPRGCPCPLARPRIHAIEGPPRVVAQDAPLRNP
jgi:hypothetical protein